MLWVTYMEFGCLVFRHHGVSGCGLRCCRSELWGTSESQGRPYAPCFGHEASTRHVEDSRQSRASPRLQLSWTCKRHLWLALFRSLSWLQYSQRLRIRDHATVGDWPPSRPAVAPLCERADLRQVRGAESASYPQITSWRYQDGLLKWELRLS